MTSTKPTAPGWYWYSLAGSWRLQPAYVFKSDDADGLFYTLDAIGDAPGDDDLDRFEMAQCSKKAMWSDRPIEAPNARYSPHGRERLWNWFGCSRASWLTMPRVMMHAMPDDWQERMAKLCEEWDAHWDTSALPCTQVQAVGENGRLTKFPDWLLNYRSPCSAEIDQIRARQEPQG